MLSAWIYFQLVLWCYTQETFGYQSSQSEENEPLVLPSACLQHRRVVNRTEDVDSKLGPTVLACKRLPHGVIFMSPVDLSLCSGIQGGEHSSHGTSITLRHWIGPLWLLEAFVGVSLRENGFSVGRCRLCKVSSCFLFESQPRLQTDTVASCLSS